MGVLYPGSLIAVVSGTAEQATLIVKKIQDYFIRNPEIMREIQADSHRAVQLSRNKGICTLKNGSKIESFSVGTMRGNRAKIVVIDESPEVKATVIQPDTKEMFDDDKYRDVNAEILSAGGISGIIVSGRAEDGSNFASAQVSM